MRYVQLRAFHNVAIHAGFSRAAEALNLTQPAISEQVRKLEHDYDVLLFKRLHKRVELTEQGHKLLELTNRLFDLDQQALEYLSGVRTLRSRTLRIIADSTHHMLHVLGEFRQKFPDVYIEIKIGNTHEVQQRLANYEADIGILGKTDIHPDYQQFILSSSPIIAFAGEHHPLSQQGAISLHKLAEQPLVMREQGSNTRQKLEEVARQQNINLNIIIEAEGREAVREVVASGAGLGVVVDAEFGHDARLRKINLLGPPITMTETMICLQDRATSPLVRAFIAEVKNLQS